MHENMPVSQGVVSKALQHRSVGPSHSNDVGRPDIFEAEALAIQQLLQLGILAHRPRSWPRRPPVGSFDWRKVG